MSYYASEKSFNSMSVPLQLLIKKCTFRLLWIQKQRVIVLDLLFKNNMFFEISLAEKEILLSSLHGICILYSWGISKMIKPGNYKAN